MMHIVVTCILVLGVVVEQHVSWAILSFVERFLKLMSCWIECECTLYHTHTTTIWCIVGMKTSSTRNHHLAVSCKDSSMHHSKVIGKAVLFLQSNVAKCTGVQRVWRPGIPGETFRPFYDLKTGDEGWARVVRYILPILPAVVHLPIMTCPRGIFLFCLTKQLTLTSIRSACCWRNSAYPGLLTPTFVACSTTGKTLTYNDIPGGHIEKWHCMICQYHHT